MYCAKKVFAINRRDCAIWTKCKARVVAALLPAPDYLSAYDGYSLTASLPL